MLEEQLQTHFSFPAFRPGQKEIVESILAGKDTLALMPTGAGKSLCFQFPAVVLPGLTVVISPLIALMKNQVDSMTASGIPATFLNSTLSREETEERCLDLATGRYKLLYLAPERLANSTFSVWFKTLPITLFAIDEAHCISSWGHDFRPEYQNIYDYIEQLPERPIIAAFTATATQLVARDIQERLHMKNPNVFVSGFDRPNLKLFVRRKMPLRERKAEALRLIKSIQGSGIIYTLTVKEAEEVRDYLRRHGVRAESYHARIKAEERTEIQNKFMENEYDVVVATIAFGMGIDKADIRYVIHIGMPPNLERYYQEAGRAGRDGEKAYCILLQNGRDRATQHYFIQNSADQMREQFKDNTDIRALISLKYEQLDAIQEYIDTETCRRKIILEYFQDPAAKYMENCRGCDICLNFDWDKKRELAGESVDDGLGEAVGGWGGRRRRSKKRGRRNVVSDIRDLSETVIATSVLYKTGKTPEQIAKIRSLGLRTIMQHLADWYQAGGTFNYSDYVTPAVEKKVSAVVERLGTDQLSPIKKALPASISYDQIKLVIAHMERVK